MDESDQVPIEPVPIEQETVGPESASPTRSRAQRLRDGATRVDHARVVATGRAIPVFERAVKFTRFPTFLVMAAPVVAAIALAIVSLFAGNSLRWVMLAVALVILLIGIGFGRRRKAMLAAVDNREALTNEFVEAFSAGNAWGRIQPQLAAMASDVSGPKQGWAVIRNWRNLISIAAVATSGLDNYPRVAPFTPSSLRVTWLLGVISVIAGFIGAALTVLVLVLIGLGLA